MFFGYWFDWTIIIMIPAMIFAILAQGKVKSTYNKYSSVFNSRYMTGKDVARMMLDQNGLSHVAIERIEGELTDHFDPKANVVRLSAGVYDTPSCSAMGVAAHECGHAIQHAQGYTPIKIRSTILPFTNFGSSISMYVIMIGLFLCGVAQSTSSYETGINIALIGVALYSLLAVFQLVTLPVEFNASKRALATLESCGYFEKSELKASKEVLSAAAMTYVAALASTLATILRFLVIILGRSNNNRRR